MADFFFKSEDDITNNEFKYLENFFEKYIQEKIKEINLNDYDNRILTELKYIPEKIKSPIWRCLFNCERFWEDTTKSVFLDNIIKGFKKNVDLFIIECKKKEK